MNVVESRSVLVRTVVEGKKDEMSKPEIAQLKQTQAHEFECRHCMENVADGELQEAVLLNSGHF